MRYLLFILFIVPIAVMGQDFKYEQKRIQITESGTVNPKDFKDDFHVSLLHLEAPYPGGENAKESIKSQKLKTAERFPRKPAMGQRNQRGTTDSLTVLQGFPVRFFLNDNPLVGGRPNDNTVAISNDGKLLTSYNTQVWGYDMVQDTYLFDDSQHHPSFGQFMSWYADTTYSLYFPFDPKLIYDPTRDRFILVFLTGRDPDNSGAIVAFSSSNNPSDVWHAYHLSGNPLNDTTWTDYPQMAINGNNLYLTLNQLYPDSSWITGFAQTVIWQMDLDAGFSGASTLDSRIWYGMEYGNQKLRYLRPVKTAMGPEPTDTMYFVCNRPFDVVNDSIFLVRIVGDVADTGASIDVKLVIADTEYGLPPDAIQPNNHVFLTNDARALGAVRINREIHFVGNTVEPNSGKSAIYHGIIMDPDQPEVDGHIITHDTRDFGYPNISFLGLSKEDREMAIFFNHTAADAPAGNSIVYYNNNREYGPVQTLKEGETYVDRIQGTDERWGDYIGIQRKFNETSRVWVAGYFSFGQTSNGTWVSEVAGPRDWTVGVEDKTETKLRLFPNPTANYLSFEFEMPETAVASFQIMDINGRLIQTIARDRVKAGSNQLTFDVTVLSPGTYILHVVEGDNLVFSEKFVKQ